MKPARSLAASVAALGFAGSVATPLPAYAAPAPCERAESYAAQSGAELLRIDRLEVRSADQERPVTKDPAADEDPADEDAPATNPEGATNRVLSAGDPTDVTGEDSDTLSEGVGSAARALIDPLLPGSDFLPPNDESATSEDEDTGGQGGGGGVPTGGEVGVGEARTAMIATAEIKSAAVARLLDGEADGHPALSEPILQQAPPTHARPLTRSTPAGRVGPLRLGAGELSGHARWDAAMACGAASGETARAKSAVHGAGILEQAGEGLVRVPEKAASVSTTALDGRGESVASATITAGRFELAGGRVTLRVLKAPSLVASMSCDGGEVRYQPALVEVSGDGVTTKRLDTAGETVDITLGAETESGVLDAAGLGDLRPASRPLPLPHVPGLPTVSAPTPITESAPAGDGTRLRITLGGVRRATKGHAIAARATAIKVSIAQGGATRGRTKSGYGQEQRLDMAIGLLEAAAVAPERATTPVAVSGAGGGLPITGPGVAGLAIGGMALLATGVGAVLFGRRRRRTSSI